VCMCVKVIESWKVRMRKPERRIYELTLRALNVQPNEAVFLDDFGVNLKSAKELGIRTIKVTDFDVNLFYLHTYQSVCVFMPRKEIICLQE